MLAGALLGAMVLSGAAIGFRSIGAYAEEPGTEIFVDTATQETAESDPFYHEVPSLEEIDNYSHYCFGVYRFRQEDPHADQIAFKYMENEQYDAFVLNATYNQIANYVVVPNVGSVSFFRIVMSAALTVHRSDITRLITMTCGPIYRDKI